MIAGAALNSGREPGPRPELHPVGRKLRDELHKLREEERTL